MDNIKILAIVGSLRKNSYNRQLALAAKKLVGDRAEFSILEYHDVPFMNQDIEFPPPAEVKRVRDSVKAADGVWFFTPEYNHFFPGVLKNLIDWLSRPINSQEGQVLAGKPAAICGVSPASAGTAIAQDHLVTLISFLNMDVMNSPRLAISHAFDQLDERGNLALSSSKPFLERYTDAFIEFIKKCIK